MDLYTVQMARGRDIEGVLDITVKSSTGLGRVFAPDWWMVKGYKDGKLSADDYTGYYHKKMVSEYYKNFQAWQELLSRPQVVLACYCHAGDFCHRLLLAQYLVKLGATYKGEIR